MSFRSFLKNHQWALNTWLGIIGAFAEIRWPRTQALFNGGLYYYLEESDHDRIRELLKDNYLVILTRRKCHLTTYVVALASLVTTGKMSHYSHALMNVEGDIPNNIDYKLIEATAPGVHYSTFMKVFDCDSAVLLKPRGVDLAEWTKVMDAVKAEFGLQYDNLFDITQDKQVSCVEMVYQGLKKMDGWEEKFPDLVRLIDTHGNNLTPQMLYDCGDMDVVFEVRR